MNEPIDKGCPETEQFPVVRDADDFYSFIEKRLLEAGLELFETSSRNLVSGDQARS